METETETEAPATVTTRMVENGEDGGNDEGNGR
jgi:hypothetical protein